MIDFLEFTLDKFAFKVATDRLYMSEGLWAMPDGDRVTVGLSDFFQQRNGDVAFADVWAAGRWVKAGEEFASVETIKVNVELPSPVSGTVVEANDRLQMEAELVNQDPYGAGWLAVIQADDWPADGARLMTPEAYLDQMKSEAEEARR
jgi:glycine cleavage system H protein